MCWLLKKSLLLRKAEKKVCFTGYLLDPPINIKWPLPYALTGLITHKVGHTVTTSGNPDGTGGNHLYITDKSQSAQIAGPVVAWNFHAGKCIWKYSTLYRVWGNSTVVSIFVYQAGGPGSCPGRSACIWRVEFFHCAIDSFPPVPTTGSKKVVHVLFKPV